MSLLSLPDELLVEMSQHLPFLSDLQRELRKKPLVQLHPGLQTLCGTNKRLRAIFIDKLYAMVVLDLRRAVLQEHFLRLKRFFP